MEDRKRSLVNDAGDADLAPSRKRLVKDENGQQMRMDAEKEKDVEVHIPPKPFPLIEHALCNISSTMSRNMAPSKQMTDRDVKNYQKDAILRQMKAYKRERKDLEEQLHELQKKTAHHDEELRAVDAWFAQELTEMRQLIRERLPTPPPSASADNPTGTHTLLPSHRIPILP
jgi:E3 ubiquitin-protein ligase BRE1